MTLVGGVPGVPARLDGRGARPSTAGHGDTMKMRFTAEDALVAGGTGGLGRAVSLAFLEEGAKVIVTYREQKELDTLKSEAGANGSKIEGHPVDVTDATAVRQLFATMFTQVWPV